MIISGGMSAKLVLYPVSEDTARPAHEPVELGRRSQTE